MQNISAGFSSLDETKTFRELSEWYYEWIAPHTLKPNVMENSQRDINNHIMPYLGQKKLRDISPLVIDSILYELYQNGNIEIHYRLADEAAANEYSRAALARMSGIDRSTVFSMLSGHNIRRVTAERVAASLGKKTDEMFSRITEKHGLSGSTVHKIKGDLSAMFSCAVRKEIIHRNPVILATAPKDDRRPGNYLNEEEGKALLEAAKRSRDFELEVIINIMLSTGIRPGECLALHWQDINLESCIIYIRNTLVRASGEFVVQPAKTASSVRRVIMHQSVRRLLLRYKNRQARQLETDIVFTNRSGGYMQNSELNRRLKRVLAIANLPESIHAHSLRHGYTSILINNNIPSRLIADRLGHAQTSTTERVYAHVFDTVETKSLQVISMSLFE